MKPYKTVAIISGFIFLYRMDWYQIWLQLWTERINGYDCDQNA